MVSHMQAERQELINQLPTCGRMACELHSTQSCFSSLHSVSAAPAVLQVFHPKMSRAKSIQVCLHHKSLIAYLHLIEPSNWEVGHPRCLVVTQSECLQGCRKPDFPVLQIIAVRGDGDDIGGLDTGVHHKMVQGGGRGGCGQGEQDIRMAL